MLRQLLEEYPSATVRFTVCQLPDEPERLGRKRMKAFRRLLEKEQIDLTRILFSDEVFRYSDALDSEVKQPAIQGVIVALE